MSLGSVEKKFKTFELYAGLAIVCFGAATAVSWVLLRQLLEHPGLIPGTDSRMFWVTIAHDAGYMICAPLFAFGVSRIVAGGRRGPALVLVFGNYLIEEVVTTVLGAERVYWAWPWALSGRLLAIAVALALSYLATRGNKTATGPVDELRSPAGDAPGKQEGGKFDSGGVGP